MPKTPAPTEVTVAPGIFTLTLPPNNFLTPSNAGIKITIPNEISLALNFITFTQPQQPSSLSSSSSSNASSDTHEVQIKGSTPSSTYTTMIRRGEGSTRTIGDFEVMGPVVFWVRSNVGVSVVGVGSSVGSLFGGDEFEEGEDDEEEDEDEEEIDVDEEEEEPGYEDHVEEEEEEEEEVVQQEPEIVKKPESSKKKKKKAEEDTEQQQLSSKKARKEESAKKSLELETLLKSNRPDSSSSSLTKSQKRNKKEALEALNTLVEKTIKGVKSNDIVKYKDFIIGAGNTPANGKMISINYDGSLQDGTVFDKNNNKKSPLKFRLGVGQVIRGLEMGIQGMRVGGERVVTIPPHLGYGKKAQGAMIPGGSTLVFRICLLDVAAK